MRSEDRGITSGRGRAAFAVGASALAGSTAAAYGGLEPWATWHYVFAWYSTLLLIDGDIARRSGRFHLFGKPAFAATAIAWSVPFWLFFELFNFRLRNWYYVFVPDDPVARWVGIVLSFATVLPAILLAERWLASVGLTLDRSSRPVRTGPRVRGVIRASGVAMLAMAIAWPDILFPLVWVGLTLALDPWVYGRDPSRSLLGDLEGGRPGRILRLLVAGLGVGLLWELYNTGARSHWIYTVPGFEELKLFEMPALGFLGFPAFALEAFVVFQALVVSGLAVGPDGTTDGARWFSRLASAGVAIAFSLAVIAGMHRATISSYTPRLEDLPEVDAPTLREAGYDVFRLAEAGPGEIVSTTGVDRDRANRWIDAARLAALRGIGSINADRLRAVGVETVERLAEQDPGRLSDRLRSITDQPVVPSRVRLWVRAAKEEAR